jgi:hexosaminidase
MEHLIPKPVSISPIEEEFALTAACQIIVDPGSEALFAVGKYLADQLQSVTKFEIPVSPGEGEIPVKSIYFKLGETDAALGQEGYLLTIAAHRIQIAAPQAAGAFYAVQTLIQLLPVTGPPFDLPGGVIRDTPRFRWRGAMLDVARHFFSVADVKRYIDLLANYKMNVLHLHLTDDQGWRIEIKSWPNLAKYGGSTAINGDPGGYYTQDEYQEIVAYAQSRYITIVPEIDLPGHTNAALASYPELNCDGVAPDLYTGGEVGFSSLCIDKEITYEFLDDVIRELAAMTPGPYIHIGGDEAKSTPKEAFRYFVKRAEEIVLSHGKAAMCWEEAAQCDLSNSTVIQYWTDVQHAEMAAQKGLQILMSPASRTYLDMKYDEKTSLGLTWAGTTVTEKSYTWDPANEVVGLAESAILGVEAPLWSETLLAMNDVEYMAFPRVIGIAEIGWSPLSGRDWAEYRQRLAVAGERLTVKGVNFYRDPGVPWK